MKDTVYSVKRLNAEIRHLLEGEFHRVSVEGEVSGQVSPASGHIYFSLKEDNSVIRCAFFRNRRRHDSVVPVNGMQVLVQGQVSCYESRGDLQLIVSSVEDAGEGALRRAFELLKKKLADEGLFDQASKKSLPEYPSTIGIVTSGSGAALHDILVTMERRYPQGKVIVYPTLVQGREAPNAIIETLRIAEERSECDVLLLARGGGSLEDLQAFNEESVARQVYRCNLPIITGIGHEIDFTICDFVADQRGATPTAAAELVTPDTTSLRMRFRESFRSLCQAMNYQLRDKQQTSDILSTRLIHPGQYLEGYQRDRKYLQKALQTAMYATIHNGQSKHLSLARAMEASSPDSLIGFMEQSMRDKTAHLIAQMQSHLKSNVHLVVEQGEKLRVMDPDLTLQRGYAIVQDNKGTVITRPDQVSTGENLDIRVAGGKIGAVTT